MHVRRGLLAQLLLLALSVVVIAEWAGHFPFPSPLIKPLLPPMARWPEAQIKSWVEAQSFDDDFLRYFARDPQRTIPAGDNLVSPADGLLRNVIVKNGVTYFIIGMSFWDVHVVRSPVAGTVTDIEVEGVSYFSSHPPKDIDSDMVRGKAAPVQAIITIATTRGDVRVRMITSYWASRLKVAVHIGQRIEKGAKLGRIVLGSTVGAELRCPGRVPVAKKQRVVGGETIICQGEERR